MDFFSFFIGWSAGLSLLFSLGEIFSEKRNIRNFYLASIFFFLFLFLIQSFLWSTKLILQFPHMLFTHLIGTLLLGPFLERYLILVWENESSSQKSFFIKLSISFFFICILIPAFLMSRIEKIDFINATFQNGISKRSIYFFLFTISILLFYLLKLLVRFFKFFRSSTLKDSITLQLILGILILGILSVLLAMIYFLQSSLFGLQINGILLGIFLIVLFFIKQRYPNILTIVQNIILEEQKYKISQLKKLDLEKLNEEIKRLFEIEKIYHEEELSLLELASRLDISSHKLSEYLNSEMKVNFFQLLNSYRMAEAKKLLLEKKEQTILSIAFAVGFQSKSAFNEVFKKDTGITPTEFRKKN